jgi:5-methylcytosine-specific restriction endonuclease McrA
MRCKVNFSTTKYCLACRPMAYKDASLAWRRAHPEAQVKRTPDQERIKYERTRARMAADPEYAEKIRLKDRLRYRRMKESGRLKSKRALFSFARRDMVNKLTCTLCKITYPQGWFGRNGHYRDGKVKRKSICRNCDQEKASVRAARRRGIGAEYTSRSLVRHMMKLQGYRCASCAIPIGRGLDGRNTFHIDHIRPISKGGLHTQDNLQLLCIKCNLVKSAKF